MANTHHVSSRKTQTCSATCVAKGITSFDAELQRSISNTKQNTLSENKRRDIVSKGTNEVGDEADGGSSADEMSGSEAIEEGSDDDTTTQKKTQLYGEIQPLSKCVVDQESASERNLLSLRRVGESRAYL